MLNKMHTVSISRTPVTLDTTTKKGIYSAGTEVITTGIKCNWQPGGKDEIQMLPEGLRNRNVWLIITSTEIFINDVIVKDGKNFRVHNIENFTGFGGSIGNYEGVCVEEDRPCA